MKQIIVRAYGAKLVGPKSETEALIGSVFREQNKLWNKLVEIEHGARKSYNDALTSSDSALGALVEQHDSEQSAIDALMEARAKARQASRSKTTDVEKTLSASIKEAAAKLKDLRVQIKVAKNEAKAKAKPALEAAELIRRDKVKEAVSAADMWWGHSETVLAKFDIARVKAMKTGTMLRFHRFDGEGSCGVRFGSKAAFDIETLESSNRTDLIAFSEPTEEMLGDRKKAVTTGGKKRVIVTLRMGSKREDGSIPKVSFMITIQADHDLPRGVPLKTVTLRCDMHVKKPVYKLVFMFSNEVESLPDVELAQGAVGIEFGFRQVLDDGPIPGLRVATAKWANGEVERCVLPSSWVSRMARADRLRSELDSFAGTFHEWVKTNITDELLENAGIAEDEWLRILLGKVRRAKGAYAMQLVDLCNAYKSAGEPLSESMSEHISSWARQALKMAESAYHTRRRAVDNRKHIFRNFAANVARRAGQAGLIDTDFRKIALLVKDDGTENELHATARRNRTWAAPSELRLALEQALKRDQREIIDVPAPHTSVTCSACGHVHESIPKDLNFVCDHCGKVHDQDENTAANVLIFSMKDKESSSATSI